MIIQSSKNISYIIHRIQGTISNLTKKNTMIGWYDKIQILDFGLTHKTGGANHKINDFCFLKFFISIKFDPHQAQKMIFRRFEQCSISLDMFERVK